MVIDFLKFSRNVNIDKENTNIQELMENVIYLLKSQLYSKRIYINKVYPQDPIFLRLDRRGMKQALINILKNASISRNDWEGEVMKMLGYF